MACAGLKRRWPGAIAQAMYQAGWPAPGGNLASIEILQALRAIGGKNAALAFDRTGSPNANKELDDLFNSPDDRVKVLQTGSTKGEGAKLKSNYAYAVFAVGQQ